MTFKELVFLIRSDLYRYHGKTSKSIFLKDLILNQPFKVSFLYRVCRYCYLNNKKIFLLFFKILFRVVQTRYMCLLSYKTDIGSGLYLGHIVGIMIDAEARIGKNLNISQFVNIGPSNRGPMEGHATIGDNVFLAPGSKVFGKVTVGNNTAVGSNSVVTRDVPDNAVVGGVPAKIISNGGSAAYVIYTDYE